ncbi:UDP binding domain-containing protein, partial [Bordetella trematum]
LAGRRLNDSMGGYVVSQLVKCMTKKRLHVQGAKVLVMGLTFKENCPDLRNTRVIDIVRELGDYDVFVDVYDPWVKAEEALEEYGINPLKTLSPGVYDAVVLAVAHEEFKEFGSAYIRTLCKEEHVFFDIKCVFPKEESDLRI